MAIANESTRESSEMQHEEHSGPGKYVLVWIALMVLTVVTVLTGRMHLPNFGLLLALVIASVKGTLVALYFMHLAEHQGANRLVIAVSVLFVALLIGLSVLDTATRFPLANAQGSRLSDMPVTEDFLKAQFGEGAQDNAGPGATQRRDAPPQGH
ncbi:MAG TPA: cytochrome C oxidase subunit IV family protein [Aggregicoccus sp.]|nr:cytochrome C oxidase subunit IV family protein [Aggregicoccus sp.]